MLSVSVRILIFSGAREILMSDVANQSPLHPPGFSVWLAFCILGQSMIGLTGCSALPDPVSSVRRELREDEGTEILSRRSVCWDPVIKCRLIHEPGANVRTGLAEVHSGRNWGTRIPPAEAVLKELTSESETDSLMTPSSNPDSNP